MVSKEEILETLRNNDEVTFVYVKKDGSERTAKGTLKKEVVESNLATPKGVGKVFDDSNIVSYYDLGANGWRSFKVENFLRFEG